MLAHAHTYMHLQIYNCTRMHISAHTNMLSQTIIYTYNTHVHIVAHLHTYTHIHTDMHVHTPYIKIPICTYIHTSAYTHTYRPASTHTYIYTCTHSL